MAKKFEKGDFITWINKPGAFGIYEGNDLGGFSQYSKKLSLVLFFDPSKYTKMEDGTYESIPSLDIATKDKRCEKTIDTDEEDYWWHKATVMQYEKAIEELENRGYRWDEEALALIELETGLIVAQIHTPKLEYNGEVIKPMPSDYKTKLVDFVKKKNKPMYETHSYCGEYPYYRREDMDDGYWD